MPAPIRKTYFVVLMWTLAMFPLAAQGATLHVNCDSTRGLTRIQKAINLLQQGGSEGPNTILVSGSCKENITIQSMDNLTLTAQNGASITDPSGGNLDGIVLNTRGTLTLSDSTVQGNQNRGILATTSSTVPLFGSTVTANGGDGVRLQQSSQARFDRFAGVNVITSNGGAGVSVGDLSFAFFDANSNVTGNVGGAAVVCAPQFSATRGALTNLSGGTTNCVEP